MIATDTRFHDFFFFFIYVTGGGGGCGGVSEGDGESGDWSDNCGGDCANGNGTKICWCNEVGGYGDGLGAGGYGDGLVLVVMMAVCMMVMSDTA